MPDPEISQSESKWNNYFGPLKQSREAILPAYCAASCQLFASICKLIPAEEKRIVTTGGGDGIFSRSELPILRKFLGEDISLHITETDPSPVIQKARALADQVYQLSAEKLTERLQPRKTHLLIGEDMIQHIVDINSFAKCTKEILSLKGVFVHPFFNIYATDDASQIPGKTIANPNDLQQPMIQSTNAYAYYVGKLHAPAKEHGLKFATILLKGQATVSANEFEQYRDTTSIPFGMAIGSINSQFGIMQGFPAESSTSNIELSYLNLSLIMTKREDTLREVLDHLTDKDFAILSHLPTNPEFRNIEF